jgi:hypothetical protein
VVLPEDQRDIGPLAGRRHGPADCGAPGPAPGGRRRAGRTGQLIVHITSTHDRRIGCPVLPANFGPAPAG